MRKNGRSEKRAPLRVCHFASGDLWAGAEVQIAALLGALKPYPDLELSALLLNSGRLSEEIALRGIPVTVCDESRLGIFRLLAAVTRHLGKLGPHILHSHRYKEHVLGALAGRLSCDPFTVQTYHGLEENLPGWAGLKMGFYDRINAVVSRATADGVIGVSSEIAGILKGRFPAADVRCIRNGIDLACVVPARERPAVRAQLGIAGDALVVGTVGRLMPIKGFNYLIEAFVLFRRRHDRQYSRLVIVGDGPLRAALGECAERHGVVRDVDILGMRTDVYDVMRAFDVFALPSLHEGVPMVLLEAMALEIPIVASRVGGVPEILEDGKEAILVPARDPGALAGAIEKVAASAELRGEMVRAARLRVETEHSIQSSAAKMRDMYRSLSAAVER